jgi:nucleotide-binding universal stress UspA family protein
MKLIDQLKTAAVAQMEHEVGTYGMRTPRVVLAAEVGDVADEILRYAARQEISLIVCGTHGRRGVAHVLLGSVAERIVREAPCPVLTVKHPEGDFVEPGAPGESAQAAPGTTN